MHNIIKSAISEKLEQKNYCETNTYSKLATKNTTKRRFW